MHMRLQRSCKCRGGYRLRLGKDSATSAIAQEWAGLGFFGGGASVGGRTRSSPAPHPPAPHLRCVAGAVCGALQAVRPAGWRPHTCPEPQVRGGAGPDGVQVSASKDLGRAAILGRRPQDDVKCALDLSAVETTSGTRPQDDVKCALALSVVDSTSGIGLLASKAEADRFASKARPAPRSPSARSHRRA